MTTAADVRTMAAYNAEMNRRLHAAADRLADADRRADRGAFLRSIHGTLYHLVWGDQMWMSRLAGWPKPTTPHRDSGGMIQELVAAAGSPCAGRFGGVGLGGGRFRAMARRRARVVQR